jgi:hypothetical protein
MNANNFYEADAYRAFAKLSIRSRSAARASSTATKPKAKLVCSAPPPTLLCRRLYYKIKHKDDLFINHIN